jgi:hypothetical protein
MRQLVKTSLGFLVLFFSSCLFDSDENSKSGPVPTFDNTSVYQLYPNDAAPNDSARNYLKSGVLLSTQPGGDYVLEVRTQDPDAGTPYLRLYKTERINFRSFKLAGFEQEIEPDLQTDGTYHLNFSPKSNKQMDYAVILSDGNGNHFSRALSSMHFSGTGQYGTQFGVNIILAGEHPRFNSEIVLDSLINDIHQVFNRVYAETPIALSQVRILKAHENPYHGGNWPADQVIIYNPEAPAPDELASWGDPQIESFLDIVVVSMIDGEGFLGLSPVYGYNLTKGIKSTVIVGTHYQNGFTTSEVSNRELANTITHEMGHFLGLRHTTSTAYDLYLGGDYSNIEDGLSDTDMCLDPNYSELLVSSMLALRRMALAKTTHCDDITNLMYSDAIPGVPQFDLSEGQINIVHKNLSLYPR